MAEKESPLKKFSQHVDEYLWVSIQCMAEEIKKIDSTPENIDELKKVLMEANSLIDFFCEEDEELYNLLRYRLFYHQDTERMTIIQGKEIDVDYRGWIEVSNILTYGGDDLPKSKRIEDELDQNDEEEDDEDDRDDEWPE